MCCILFICELVINEIRYADYLIFAEDLAFHSLYNNKLESCIIKDGYFTQAVRVVTINSLLDQSKMAKNDNVTFLLLSLFNAYLLKYSIKAKRIKCHVDKLITF